MKSKGKTTKRSYFDCSKCPAYCCSVYDIVNVERSDIERLAKHFGVDYETALRRYTKAEGKGRVLRRKADPMLGRACHFLDLETRRCKAYDARPQTCREFPDATRCGFYDLLQFERKHAGDETVLPLVKITYFE